MTFEELKSCFIELAKQHGLDACFQNNEATVLFPDGIKNMGKLTTGVRFGMIREIIGHDYSGSFEQLKKHFIKYVPQMKAGIIK